MTPTDEQCEILSLANSTSNLQIIAYAGTGKTSTLELLAKACSTKPKLCLAFNKRIAEEMAKRFPDTTDCRTFNSLGHRIWSKTIPKRVTLDTKKTSNLFKEVAKAYSKNDQKNLWENYFEITSAVGLAKSVGYVPKMAFTSARRLCNGEFFNTLEDRLSPMLQTVVDQILIWSIKTGYEGNLDFNDQIYLPALFGGTFPRFPVVMVDEAQDLSPTNHAMIEKLCKHTRLISVGDPYQSIYGFRGAKIGGMQAQALAFDCLQRTLSISFRCQSEIVKSVHWRVPDFRWQTKGGRVERLDKLEPASIVDGAAIISRNNAPLFGCALNLLACGRSVRVAGSDIGPKLVGILRRFGDEGISRSAVLGQIADWEARKAEYSSSAKDLADCMRLFASHSANLGQAIAYAEYLFAQEGTIALITGHKAKGLEWNTVYHLDPWLIRESEQELNLRYVIQTRARECYFEIDSKAIQWKNQ